MKFKIGDKVIVTKTNPVVDNAAIGDMCVIIRIALHFDIVWYHTINTNGDKDVFEECDIELAA